MRPIEASQVIRLLSGYWPHPEMTDDEIRVWTLKLAECEPELSVKQIENLARTGRDFRPTVGQFLMEYDAHTPRFRGTPVMRDALPMTTEDLTPAEWMDRAREQLINATGPLATDLKRTIEIDEDDLERGRLAARIESDLSADEEFGL